MKLDRADKHLAEFEQLLAAYYSRRPMSLDGHFDPERSQWVTTMAISEDPPPELSVVIGDIAHNLRSALDQLTWQLALVQTQEPYARTQFPIFTDADDYKNHGARMVQSLRPEHAAFIERLQPYHEAEPEESLLYGLNRLSNVDKHREVHFANSALMGASLRIQMTGGGIGIGGIQLTFGGFTSGNEVARIDVVPGPDQQEPRFEVGIDGAFDLTVTDEGREISVWAGMHATREFVGDLVALFVPVLH